MSLRFVSFLICQEQSIEADRVTESRASAVRDHNQGALSERVVQLATDDACVPGVDSLGHRHDHRPQRIKVIGHDRAPSAGSGADLSRPCQLHTADLLNFW